jgi:hypothetical protein
MPKLLKRFSIVKGAYGNVLLNGEPVFDSDFYFELYKAYKKYYLIAFSCIGNSPTVIKFSNLLNAIMLFKEIQNDAISKNLMILQKEPYWVMKDSRFNRKFWTKIKKSNRIIMNPGPISGAFSISRVNDYLEYK